MTTLGSIESFEQAVRERLLNYRYEEREIDNQIERIDNLGVKMVSIKSPEMNGMPRAQSPASDRIGKMLAQKDELEREVRGMINHHYEEREWINATLRGVKNPDERACIQMRYLDMESWRRVSEMLYGAKKDFQERTDSYLRRTSKLHNRAIRHMALVIETKGDAHNAPVSHLQ